MISLEYEKFQQRVSHRPIEAAKKLHEHIDENVRTRTQVIKELSDRQRWSGARETYVGASELADKLIEENPEGWDFWTKGKYDCTSVTIETHSLGSYALTRFSKDCRDEYDISIENESLNIAIAGLRKNHSDRSIDLLATIEDITDEDFTHGEMAEIEWGFELLMTIALDAKGYN